MSRTYRKGVENHEPSYRTARHASILRSEQRALESFKEQGQTPPARLRVRAKVQCAKWQRGKSVALPSLFCDPFLFTRQWSHTATMTPFDFSKAWSLADLVLWRNKAQARGSDFRLIPLRRRRARLRLRYLEAAREWRRTHRWGM